LSFILLGSAALGVARPLTGTDTAPLAVRTVTALDPVGFAQAQQRDNTATRAFSSAQIKTSDGKCLFIDELSGDDRANLTPVQIVACNATNPGQLFDVITAGIHQNTPGQALIVSSEIQTCLNFDPRRAAGNQVIMFSCGGRADGSGAVTNAQQFAFTGGAGPLTLRPLNSAGTCLTEKGALLDQASCSNASTQEFTIVAGSGTGAVAVASAVAVGETSAAAVTTAAAATASADSATETEDCDSVTTSIISVTVSATSAVETDCAAASTVTETVTQTVTVTAAATATAVDIAVTTSAAVTTAAAVTTQAAATITGLATTTLDIQTNTALISTANPTVPVSVSRAGGVLQPTAAAQANIRDATATRAFSSVTLKNSAGLCLFIDPTAGDFRQELIPVQMEPCTGSPNELFDIITAGVHNNAPNSMLIVSTLTQGCLNFDDRRAIGDQVIMFSCGGRADGTGQTTNSQLFPTTTLSTKQIVLTPESGVGTCLVNNNGLLAPTTCDNSADQIFTIV